MEEKFLEEKLNTLSRNIDFANSRLVFLEKLARTYIKVDKMPLSQGWMRLLHQAGGKLLELVDLICKEHKIPYWLYAGSLIGAKLYKHSIPWDDDWDIGMLREDYEKFRELCLILFENSDIINPTFLGFSIQIKHKNLPIYGDVFPFDFYYEDINNKSQEDYLIEKLKKAKKEVSFKLWHWDERLKCRSMKLVNEQDYQQTRKFYNEIIMENKEACAKGVLLENPLVPGTTLNNIYKYDWIFPLKKCKYEGVTVCCPNDSDAVLARKFGDILDLPPNLANHKTTVSMTDILEIKKFIKKDMKKLYKKIKIKAGYDAKKNKIFTN